MSKQLPNWLYLLEDVSSSQDFGVGIDIEEVQRWRDPTLKLDQLFTEEERAYCESKACPAEHYAGHWCAKEAVFKAVSPFITVSLRRILITHKTTGEPIAKISTNDHSLLERNLRLSISHSPTIAIALAILQIRQRNYKGKNS